MASTDAPAPTAAVDETPVSTENQTEQTENVMPASSIEAANQALNSALEAANITKDDDDESSKAASDGQIKTVFHDNASFNVKVRLLAHVPPLERPVNRGLTLVLNRFRSLPFQHPLYSPWTLWYESPQTKNLPKLAPAVSPLSSLPRGLLSRYARN